VTPNAIQIQKNSTIEQQDLAIKTIKNTFEANKPSSAKLLLSGASIVAVEILLKFCELMTKLNDSFFSKLSFNARLSRDNSLSLEPHC
jgi:hypothetical protein